MWVIPFPNQGPARSLLPFTATGLPTPASETIELLGAGQMKVLITPQSNDRGDALTMVIDTTVHTLYRGCRTLEDVRARCQKVLDNSIFYNPHVRIIDIKEITGHDKRQTALSPEWWGSCQFAAHEGSRLRHPLRRTPQHRIMPLLRRR